LRGECSHNRHKSKQYDRRFRRDCCSLFVSHFPLLAAIRWAQYSDSPQMFLSQPAPGHAENILLVHLLKNSIQIIRHLSSKFTAFLFGIWKL